MPRSRTSSLLNCSLEPKNMASRVTLRRWTKVTRSRRLTETRLKQLLVAADEVLHDAEDV